MSRNTCILLVGVLVFIMPFLGFPSLWKTLFYVLAGLCLIMTAVTAHMRKRVAVAMERHEVVTEVFVETKGSERT